MSTYILALHTGAAIEGGTSSPNPSPYPNRNFSTLTLTPTLTLTLTLALTLTLTLTLASHRGRCQQRGGWHEPRPDVDRNRPAPPVARGE